MGRLARPRSRTIAVGALGGKGKAKIKLTFTDQAGNQGKDKLSVKLKK